MAVEKSSYPEIEHIKEDLESLKDNVVELTRHVQENGADKTQELAKRARRGVSKLQTRSKRELQKLERQIKAKPAQSIAIAFAAGLFASALLGRGR